MTNLVWEYMKKHGMVTGDVGKDRRTYIELAFLGGRDPYEVPLDGELEAELPEHLQLYKIMEGEQDE
jgi:hypothetical protein